MTKYFIVVLVLCGLMLLLCAGIAAAGCCTGEASKPGQACGEQGKCGQKPCNVGGTAEVSGTIKTVDLDRDEVVISHDGTEDVTIQVDRALAERLKEGDTIKLSYEKKCVNVAASVVKPRSGFKMPPPCTDKKI